MIEFAEVVFQHDTGFGVGDREVAARFLAAVTLPTSYPVSAALRWTPIVGQSGALFKV